MTLITLDLQDQDRTVNMVKGMHGFRNKADAIRHIVQTYEEEILEPMLQPEFIKRMQARQKEPTVSLEEFEKRLGLKDVRHKAEKKRRKDS